MITFEEFNKFPIGTKKKVINMVFGSNLESDVKDIENSILNEGEKSEYIDAILDNVDRTASYAWGNYYNVCALIYVSSKEMGMDPEEDNS